MSDEIIDAGLSDAGFPRVGFHPLPLLSAVRVAQSPDAPAANPAGLVIGFGTTRTKPSEHYYKVQFRDRDHWVYGAYLEPTKLV